jgi:putative Holliday junction resolvase
MAPDVNIRNVRAIGLDVGSKTIGVAVSDELGMLAHPRTTLARRGTRADVEAVVALAEGEQAAHIVVGLPLSLSGEVGPRARRVLVLVDALRARLGERVAVDTWDERFSTVAAERALLEQDLPASRRRALVDQAAAAFILQGWLDAQSRPR